MVRFVTERSCGCRSEATLPMMNLPAMLFMCRAISPEWSAANNVSDIEAFQVFLNQEPVGETDPSEMFYTLYNLTNNTAYSFQAKAVLEASSIADPLETAVVIGTTDNLSVPGKPDPPVQVTVGGGSIRVRARFPHDSGGAALATLTVEARSSDDNSVVEVTQPVSSPEAVFFGLSAKTRYFVSMYTTNAGGLNGPRSDYLEATTTALEVPGPCPPPTVLRVTGSFVIPIACAMIRGVDPRLTVLLHILLQADRLFSR